MVAHGKFPSHHLPQLMSQQRPKNTVLGGFLKSAMLLIKFLIFISFMLLKAELHIIIIIYFFYKNKNKVHVILQLVDF